MTVRYYPAIFEDGKGKGISVFFPDLPGCVSAGDDLTEAVAMAEEALALYVQYAIERGKKLPEPSPLEYAATFSGSKVVARQLVRVEMPGKSVRLSITMDEGLLRRVDRVARQDGLTRSGFLAEGARRMMAGGRRRSSPESR
ncbi:MAG: HicB family protein [Alphaproteobacteria bacterium]|nr:HicB family protein [Alphaproteobacteria bacterium]